MLYIQKQHTFYQHFRVLFNPIFRNKEPGTRKKNIYFTTTKVRSLVENNADRVKIINTGIKAFARADNKGSDCDYRYFYKNIKVFRCDIEFFLDLYESISEGNESK